MMEGGSIKAWAGLLLGLLVGFSLASKFIMPRSREMLKIVLKHRTSGGHCVFDKDERTKNDFSGGLLWQSKDKELVPAVMNVPRPSNFIFIGVMTAQKYLKNRATAAHR